MGRFAPSGLTAAMLVLSSVSPPTGRAAVVIVPDDFPTIQQAVDSADTVLVRSGKYPEQPILDPGYGGPKLLRRHPDAMSRPTVDGVLFTSGISWPSPTKLEGFEVIGGVHASPGGWGHAVEIDACVLDSGFVERPSSGDEVLLTLTRSRVHGTIQLRNIQATANLHLDTLIAGGLSIEYGRVTASITSCVFEGPGFIAIALRTDGGSVSIRDNRIAGYWTGIRSNDPDVNLDITGNVITDCDEGINAAAADLAVDENEVRNCGVGIWVYSYLDGESRQVTDNRVMGSSGVGIRVQDEGSQTFVQYNVVGRGAGHGIMVETTSDVDGFPPSVVANNTSYGNQGSGFVLSHLTLGLSQSLPRRVSNNIAYGNQGYALEWSESRTYPEAPPAVLEHMCNDWFANDSTVTGTPPNPLDLELDPLFCDVGSDSVSLQAGSPLLGAVGCGLIGARGMGCAATPVLVSVAHAEGFRDRVEVAWEVGGLTGGAVTVYRAESIGAWHSVATTSPDGLGRVNFTDRDVTPGRRYGYRLGVIEDGLEVLAGETWVDVPALDLALHGAQPNPSGRQLSASITLPDRAPATLELVDVSGRRLLARDVGSLGAGRHLVDMTPDESLAAGVYWLRLTQGGRTLAAKTALVK